MSRGGRILRGGVWSRRREEQRRSRGVLQGGAGHLENRGRGELWERQNLEERKKGGEGRSKRSKRTGLRFWGPVWPSCGPTLTLSLLALGGFRSWSRCCWFQLEPVGPDMLRPTTG